MRKIIMLSAMLLCAIFVLCSCNNNGDDLINSDLTSNESHKENETLSEEDQIKQDVLNLMTLSDEQKDPAELFSNFDGDYKISNLTTSYDRSTYNISKKNAVLFASSSSSQYYGVEASGYLFYVADNASSPEVIGVLPLASDDSSKSTIFTAFGIDTGAIYGVAEEEDIMKLTADMLTVSEDKSTCQISKEYIDELAKQLCEAMGYNEQQTNSFLDKYKGSGVYHVAENKIVFDISFNDTALGKINQKISYSIDNNQKVDAYSFMEYTNPSLGISTPITSEITYSDVVYRGTEPVSATIKIKTVTDESYREGDYYGAPYIEAVETVTTTFKLDCSDTARPKCTAVKEDLWKENYHGETLTSKFVRTMSVDLSKQTSQFSFEGKQDGEVLQALKADKVTFGTPTSFPEVPARVTNAILKEIEDMFD